MKSLILFLFVISSHLALAQIYACTDVLAKNFNPNATINDGSCKYKKVKIKPIFSSELSATVHETSGLIFWKEKLWTVNDDRDTNLYQFDTVGNNLEAILLKDVLNKDWEALAQDSSHIFVGDFGNNLSGNRQDLHILKIDKQSILENSPKIDTIAFSFENQNNFEAQKPNKANFDCETLLVTQDSIYIFTKEWKAKKTSCYVLPKNSGIYQAKFKASLDVNGLITGGTISEQQKIIVLCGYSKTLQPFLYLLYDYAGTDFFSGNRRKIKVRLPFHQIEGIATNDGLRYFLTNEAFQRKPFINIKQQLHAVDLSVFIKLQLANSRN